MERQPGNSKLMAAIAALSMGGLGLGAGRAGPGIGFFNVTPEEWNFPAYSGPRKRPHRMTRNGSPCGRKSKKGKAKLAMRKASQKGNRK